MTDTAIIQVMTETEATEKTWQIRDHMRQSRQLALEIFEREGWRAMGYDSFKAWAEGEFDKSFQYVYRLKDAALIERYLNEHSPLGESIPERHARELKALPDPALQYEAYQNAKHMAQVEGDKVVSTRHVQASVEVIKAKQVVFGSPYAVIGHLVTTGDITALEGQAMVEAVEKLKPKTRGFIMQVLAKWKMSCPELIPELAQMAERPPEQESKTLETILATGCVAGTPLAKATMTDLKRARYEASLEHQAEREEAERQAKIKRGEKPPEPVVTTVFKHDAERTVKALQRALGQDDLRGVFVLLAAHLGFTETLAEVYNKGIKTADGAVLNPWEFSKQGAEAQGDQVHLFLIAENIWNPKKEEIHTHV